MNDVDDSIVVAPSAIVKRVAHAGLLFGADDESLKFAGRSRNAASLIARSVSSGSLLRVSITRKVGWIDPVRG